MKFSLYNYPTMCYTVYGVVFRKNGKELLVRFLKTAPYKHVFQLYELFGVGNTDVLIGSGWRKIYREHTKKAYRLQPHHLYQMSCKDLRNGFRI